MATQTPDNQQQFRACTRLLHGTWRMLGPGWFIGRLVKSIPVTGQTLSDAWLPEKRSLLGVLQGTRGYVGRVRSRVTTL